MYNTSAAIIPHEAYNEPYDVTSDTYECEDQVLHARLFDEYDDSPGNDTYRMERQANPLRADKWHCERNCALETVGWCPKTQSFEPCCDCNACYENEIAERPAQKQGKTRGRAWRRQMDMDKEQRLVKLIDIAGYNPAMGWVTNGYIRYPKDSRNQRAYKKLTSKIARKADVASGNQYRKHFDFWWALY